MQTQQVISSVKLNIRTPDPKTKLPPVMNTPTFNKGGIHSPLTPGKRALRSKEVLTRSKELRPKEVGSKSLRSKELGSRSKELGSKGISSMDNISKDLKDQKLVKNQSTGQMNTKIGSLRLNKLNNPKLKIITNSPFKR